MSEKAKSKLELSLEEITKRYGKGSVIQGNEKIVTERQSSGSLGIDIITGGGWGRGRMVEVFAPESSGKTTLTIHTMVQAQKDQPNKKVAFIDVEHAFDISYATSLGLNIEKMIFAQPDSGEEALEIAEMLIKSGEISVCVIDSVAALTPKAEIEGDMGDSKMGLQARLMSQACRKLTSVVSNTNTVLFWTNQLREKIGVIYGSNEVTTGGNALKFYASVRVDMRRKAGNKDEEGNVKDNRITVKTVKNKLAPPFRKCEFDIIFGKGISRESEVIEWGVAAGFIKKAGSWFSFGDTKLGQGAEAVRILLEDNSELSNEIEDKIRKHYNI